MFMVETFKKFIVAIHPAGRPFIAMFFSITLVGGFLWAPIYFVGGVLTAWCIYFFRDPIRITPIREGLIVSPADGVIQMITLAIPPPELDMPVEQLTRLSIFMNVFDVHVNRAPVDGFVSRLGYRPGKFINASLDKSSNENERQSVKIRTHDGTEIALVQIAGLVARRIVCWIKVDRPVGVGERIGMIRFGSRVDIYLPNDVAPLVVSGQRVIGGETILADMQSNEKARKGSAR